ncbi:unnamed protein product [Medioppia subpectinata]|uniref:Uncharacterized protein n=1 Tax=Medioppia subpectinata TaxID=1979941 RepID=A0A7R9KD23_9ACAR|nr:unnamed protein product [Medioppia subpectinata]CAG2101193.1 unnamed protein product [Medioppia subpectinata]
MTTNPIIVLVSVKTLRPEVEDYWLSIPSVLKTIDALKLYVMTNESIDSCADADDIGLYLNSGLLRDNTAIDGVLRDRDRIEVRVKPVATEPWISSSSAATIEPISITVDESDDPSVVWTLEMSRILSGITSAEELRVQYSHRRQDERSSDPIGGQTQANSDRQLSTHSSASVATNYSAIRPIRQSAKKVVKKAVIRRVSDGKVGNQSKAGKNQISNENSVPEVTGHESRRSTTGQRSRNQLKPPPPSNRKRLNDSFSSRQPMATDWPSPQLSATTSAANRPATGVTQSGGRCLTTSITIATEDRPKTSWSAPGLSRRQRCEAPGCGYSSQSRVAFQYHQRIHRLKRDLFGDHSSIFEDIVAKHHLKSGPSVSPEIPLTRCPHENYLILTEDPFVLSN